MTLTRKAKKIVKTLQKNGHQAVFAGGSVRDMLLSNTPHDYDIATSATPEQVESLFKNTRAVGKAFGVILVKYKDVDFEVATFRSDGHYSDGRRPDEVVFTTIEEDAARRDFTVNAMFYNPINKQVIDYVNGLQDLENKVLRFVGNAEERINEDNLRLLRAVRFSLKLNFEMDIASFNQVRFNAEKVQNVAPERIREELMKMIELGKPRKMIQLLFQTGLMHQVLPEVVNLKGSPQNPEFHLEGDVLEHTILVMEKLVGQNPLMQLAGLLHDIAKPTTLVIEDGRPTNKGHDAAGADMTETIMLRLKFSNDEIEFVKNLVADHMRHHIAKEFRKSTLKRYLALPYFNELMLLNEADTLSASGNLEHIEFLREKMSEWKPEVIRPKPLITGLDLIKLGYKPGPIFTTILDHVSDLQLEGQIANKNQALRMVNENYPLPR
jgi:poly(A) polymerase